MPFCAARVTLPRSRRPHASRLGHHAGQTMSIVAALVASHCRSWRHRTVTELARQSLPALLSPPTALRRACPAPSNDPNTRKAARPFRTLSTHRHTRTSPTLHLGNDNPPEHRAHPDPETPASPHAIDTPDH
jgi:hypothetical protein